MPATAEETRRYMLVYYVALSSIFWFDWLVTLHKEYRKIWKSKWTAVKVVYLVNRYTMLALTVFILQGFNMDWSTSRCNKYLLGWQNALPLIVQTMTGFMLMIRCYAIWGNNKMILTILMILHVVHIGISCWLSISNVKTMVFPGDRGPCIPYNSRPNLMFGCITALVYDLAATGLTLYKALQVKQMIGKTMKSTILLSIIKHGTFYTFGTAVIVSANMALIHESSSRGTPFRGYLGGNLCTVFNTILACRLALSLKKNVDARQRPTAESITGWNESRLPMGGSEGSGIPLSPGAWSSRKGLSNAYTNPSISGSGSGFLGSTAINSPNNSGKITLPAFPRGSLKRKKSVPSYDRHGSGIVISQDELETYDSGILELEYIEEEEKGRASSENGREDNGSKGGMFEKDDKVEKEIELRRASAVIKALEEDQGKDLEKGESENDIENEKQGEFFR